MRSSSSSRLEGGGGASASSPRNMTQPISIRRPPAVTHGTGAVTVPSASAMNGVAASCPAPRAPIIGSLPPPTVAMMMPDLALPPPSPAADDSLMGMASAARSAGHGRPTSKLASSAPAAVAHFPDRIRRGGGTRMLGSFREEAAEGAMGAATEAAAAAAAAGGGALFGTAAEEANGAEQTVGSVTAISMLQEARGGVPLVDGELIDDGGLDTFGAAGRMGTDSNSPVDRSLLQQKTQRTFSNTSDGGDFGAAADAALRADAAARRGSDNSDLSALEDGVEAMGMTEEGDVVFDFED